MNGREVAATNFDVGENNSADSFKFGDVTYSITAGIAQLKGDNFKDANAAGSCFAMEELLFMPIRQNLLDGVPSFRFFNQNIDPLWASYSLYPRIRKNYLGPQQKAPSMKTVCFGKKPSDT